MMAVWAVGIKGLANRARRVAGRLRRGLPWRDRRGGAILEFSILMPAFAIMLLGAVEAANYFWARGRVQDAGVAIGDMTSRFLFIHDNDVKQIMAAANVIIAENNAAETVTPDVKVKLTHALGCDCNPKKATDKDKKDYEPEICYQVLWSHIYEKGQLKPGDPYKKELKTIPKDLTIAEGDTLVVTETTYKFSPKIKFVLPDSLFDMNDLYYNRARSTGQIVHTGSLEQNPVITCEDLKPAAKTPTAGGGETGDAEHDGQSAGNSNNDQNNNNSGKNQGATNGQGQGTTNK